MSGAVVINRVCGAGRAAIRSRHVDGLRCTRSGLDDSFGISRDAHGHRYIGGGALDMRGYSVRNRGCTDWHSNVRA